MNIHSRSWWMSRVRLALLLAFSWTPLCSGAFATPGGAITADDANLETDKTQPKAELDWLVEVLQREPFRFDKGEVKAHFSPLAGKADYIVDFEALVARVTGKLVLKEMQTEGDGKIYAVLVDTDSDFAVSMKLKVRPWWFPYVVVLIFHDFDTERHEDVAGGWGVGWFLLCWRF